MGFGRLSCLAALAGMSMPAIAAAQDIRMDTRLFVERVRTDINGQSRRTIANDGIVQPGDQMIVVIDWRHEGSRTARGRFITRPVPQAAQLDLSDPMMQLSVDGGRHWGRIGQLWLPTPLGGVRRATAQDVTHVRWPLPDIVMPGQAGRLSYRATRR